MYEPAGAHVSRVKTGHLRLDHPPGDRRPGHHVGGRGNDVIAKGGSAMKVVVIGGTGLIGSKLVEKLREAGHDALAASPDTGVDILTGEGLDEALDGADVVVDVSNAPAWDDAAVMDFFLNSSRNILTGETAAGTSHHVALSVVGTDRLPQSGYFRAKLAQEEAIKAATVPYTIVRATPVLRVSWPHRRFQYQRRDGSDPTRAGSARGGRGRRHRVGGRRGGRAGERARSSWPAPKPSGSTSSPAAF
jgi:uncharacterized protein YbjT (DUF2867 family)